MERLLALFGAIGAAPTEAEDERLRRALLVGFALLISFLATLWGLLYIAFGEPLSGAIPLACTLLSLASIVVLALTRRYDLLRLTQLTLMLVLPFALMIALGGFIPSSVVVSWAFFAPLGALAFATPREALRWFAAYLVLLVAVGIIGGEARAANNLPPALISAMFIVNITAVSVLVFWALYVFVRERDRALAAVQRLFGQYLSPQIARTLLSDPARAALGGENREVTALFADLQGFTQLVESRAPHHTVLVLNRYFKAVVPVIFTNGGTIIQFAGDAIVAVWNAPIEQPRHALAATRTALAMQRAIEAIVQEDPSLPRFRVGIATGAALVGNVGSEEFRNWLEERWVGTPCSTKFSDSHIRVLLLNLSPEAWDIGKDILWIQGLDEIRQGRHETRRQWCSGSLSILGDWHDIGEERQLSETQRLTLLGRSDCSIPGSNPPVEPPRDLALRVRGG